MNIIVVILFTLIFPPLSSFSALHIKTLVSKIGDLENLGGLVRQGSSSDKAENESEQNSDFVQNTEPDKNKAYLSFIFYYPELEFELIIG